tara:strand:- start:1064 stop:1384 length:321 start_codon:yes stop_codon:yes gene_type:complete
MEYILSIFIGFGISIILWLAPILTGIFGKFPWIWYVSLAIYVPFIDFDVPVLPYVIISASASFYFFRINDEYSRTQAMSSAPEWAARCQVSYLFLVMGSYVVSWFI